MVWNNNPVQARRDAIKNSAAATEQLRKLMKEAETSGGSRGSPESTTRNPAPQVDVKK